MDMLVRLYDLKDDPELYARLKAEGIEIKQALAPDKHKVVQFVRDNFWESWGSECEAAFANQPVTCYIAVKDKEIVGFGCYEATARDFFGPTGVREDMRGKGVGRALLLKCLFGMANMGYAYAIIGSAGENAMPLYEKAAGVIGSEISVYGRMICYE